jgi:F420-non-reducing hydrogenase iron-sulfur subunit
MGNMSESNTMSTSSATAVNPGPVISIVCERSVDFTGKLSETGHLTDSPNIKVIPVPCSGMIQPIMIETALKKGACGVIAMGCRMGDCHYREGNKFLRERLLGTRMPKLKPNVDKKRVQAFWLSAVEYDKYVSMATDFNQSLVALSQPDGVPC